MTSFTKFNANNKGYEKGYPLFLGDQLGVIDTINIQYPKLEDLYQKQLSQIWNEHEIGLEQDKMDMLNVPKGTRDLMVKTIMFQTSADSCACRSIVEILGKYISNSELLNLVTLQTFFEVIHARTYSHIIKQTFADPSDMLEDLYSEANVIRRLGPIVKAFDEITNLSPNATHKQKKQAIIKTMTALFALEAISFMSSFAVTFAITETDVFQGIGQLVTLICKDEVLHGRMDYEVLNILKQDPEWEIEMIFLTEQLKEILDSVIRQEEDWTDYLFSEGRQVIGLGATLLKDYVYYMAKPVYDALNIPFDFKVVTKNPLPYMDKYIDSTLVMALPQEIQITSYKVGAVKDDTEDLNLDFDL